MPPHENTNNLDTNELFSHPQNIEVHSENDVCEKGVENNCNYSQINTESETQSLSKSITSITTDDSGQNISSLTRGLSCKDIAVILECKRLKMELEICELGGLSEKYSSALLSSANINSKYSRDCLINTIIRRAGVKKRFGYMCPDEHGVMYENDAVGKSCPSQKCTKKVTKNNRYWYRLVSEMIESLCKEKNSFQMLLEGCRQIRNSLDDSNGDRYYDYYDGNLFHRKYAILMRNYKEDEEIIVFLKCSSDGFKELDGRDGERNAWPLIFIILNYPPNLRFQAAEALLTSFIPGCHDCELFDLFLKPIIDDLKSLESGIEVECVHGKTRLLRVFVLFISADWPAMSKLTGYSYHSSTHPCRMCMKKSTYNSNIKSSNVIPIGKKTDRLKVLRGDQFALRKWLSDECPFPRTDRGTRKAWKDLDFAKRSKYTKKFISNLVRQTGIRRTPIFLVLNIVFGFGLPYDFMHQVLLGYVKLVISLLTGFHTKCSDMMCTYVLPSCKLDLINLSLHNAPEGIPSAWGRAPR